MPIYCFTSSDGDVLELPFGVKGRPARGTRNGKTYRYDFAATHRGFRDTPGTFPMASEAMGVSHEDIKEAMEVDRRLGVPTEYTPDGRPVFVSRKHRKAYCEAHGFYDRNGGYGDPQRRGLDWHSVDPEPLQPE